MQEIVINVDSKKNKIVSLVKDTKLIEKYEETNDDKRLEGNIYIGKVKDVLHGMQAAFIDIGEDKNTFIHIRDIIPKKSNETGNKNEVLSKYDIKNYIKPNMPILVQVKRDGTNRKGARVSTHLSLSGRFVVLMPKSNFITISQKIEDTAEKERLKQIVKNNIPKGYGVIIRTSAEGQIEEKIKKDIDKLVKQINEIEKKFDEKKDKEIKPQLLYSDGGIVNKVLIDLIDHDVSKIWVNDEKEFEKIKNMVKETENEDKIKVELKKQKLLQMYDLDSQIEKLSNRKIWLKCGGFITIDKTEALTAIDVNSGKCVGTNDLEQTVFNVNKEATVEIAKQLRLRDIGGIIIIDYIDMKNKENKQKIENLLKEALKEDRAKTQVEGFTKLNLMELTRKHICSHLNA